MPTNNEQNWRPALVPATSSLKKLREAARECTACHLHKHATQMVFGEGPKKAAIMLVGEQPGDQEDLAGKPFVGPAGKIMDRALEDAGIDRKKVYVTNVVKHFKWEPARQATHPSKTEFARDCSLSAMAGSGTAGRETDAARLFGRDRCANNFRAVVPRHV